jgi:hypothetical protein
MNIPLLRRRSVAVKNDLVSLWIAMYSLNSLIWWFLYNSIHWLPSFWTRRTLGYWVWGPSGTLLKEQGSYNQVPNMGHKGPILRPRWVGSRGARTPSIFYSILSTHYLFFFFFKISLSNHFLQFQSLLSQLNQFLMSKIQIFWEVLSCWLVKLPVLWRRRSLTAGTWRWRHYATLHYTILLQNVGHYLPHDME